MTSLTRRRFGTLAGATFLTGCTVPGGGPVSPDLVTQDDKKDPFEGGIGGTGIVGIVTDFSSLIVNGLRVEVTTATQVATPFGPTGIRAVSRGTPLTIFAEKSRDALVARSVRIALPLVGTVRETGQGLTVNGAPVRTEPGAIGRLVPGARVAIGGVWGQSGVVASRIDPADQPADLIAGDAGREGPTGLSVQGIPVRLQRNQRLPLEGSYVTLIGTMEGGIFTARQVEPRRFASIGVLRQLSVEGFLEPVSQAPGFRVAGLGHSFSAALQLGALASSRAVYFGRYTGTFAAQTGYVVPEQFDARRALLRDGIAGTAVRVRA